MTAADTPEWAAIADSAARLVATAQALTDDDLHDASALPGWTRAHVLIHIAQSADSRTGLLRAAQAGRIGQQYPSEQARADAIDAGARRPAGIIRADLDRAIQECLTAIREHPSQLWDAPGISLGAGRRPVRDVLPSMRRELEYHHVDLAAGYQPADWRAEHAPQTTDLARITTLHPRTYNEARTIGEHFREGTPVIMNLTEMVDSDAKRLVDFAAGLIFGLRGSIERVTNKVFLLSPANVEVTAEDKARIAERDFFNQS